MQGIAASQRGNLSWPHIADSYVRTLRSEISGPLVWTFNRRYGSIESSSVMHLQTDITLIHLNVDVTGGSGVSIVHQTQSKGCHVTNSLSMFNNW